MKNSFRPLKWLVLLLAFAVRAQAQTFTELHAFAGTGAADGVSPWGGLVLSQNVLYGTAFGGGLYQEGTLFSVNTDGSGFTNFYHFTGGADGANPYSGLTLSGNTLYGTTSIGGVSGSGTVFKINTDGSGFLVLQAFTGLADGGKPWAGLLLSGNRLYGTAQTGGSSGLGVVYAVNTDGTQFKVLHNFTGTSDGASPYAGLFLSGNTLYGTASGGGSSGNGTVYALSTDGTGFTNLYNFMATSGAANANSDGAIPWAGLTLVGDTLVGVASGGGAYGSGTIFSLGTNGTNFTVLHTFTAQTGPVLANYDGASPVGRLLLSGQTLYGPAEVGGSSGAGTLFSMGTNGSNLKTLYSFSLSAGLNAPNTDGAYPVGELVLAGNTLYGTAYSGGSSGYGAVFSLSLTPTSGPELTIAPSGSNIILTWPTNATGFTLESTTNLTAPVWSTVSPGAVVVNGVNTVTNSVSGAQQYFRLIR